MTKKELDCLLGELKIYKIEYIDNKKLSDYSEEDVHVTSDGIHVFVHKCDLGKDDIDAALLAQLLKNSNSIKNMLTYFTVLSVTSLIVGALYLLSILKTT
jgi:hypothetical protein